MEEQQVFSFDEGNANIWKSCGRNNSIGEWQYWNKPLL
jgi:hypothetical protein